VNRPARIALGTVGLVAGGAGVFALREATLSTHQPVPRGSQIEVVISARTRGAEATQRLDEMVQAQLLTCRLEVNSDVVGALEPLGDGEFRAVLAPSMDETDRRQFKGCLEDFMVDHLQLNVLHLEESTQGR
jgi:hypothetical protein